MKVLVGIVSLIVVIGVVVYCTRPTQSEQSLKKTGKVSQLDEAYPTPAYPSWTIVPDSSLVTQSIDNPISAPILPTTGLPAPLVHQVSRGIEGSPLNFSCAAGTIAFGTMKYGKWDNTSAAMPARSKLYAIPSSCLGKSNCSIADLTLKVDRAGDDPFPSVQKQAEVNYSCQA